MNGLKQWFNRSSTGREIIIWANIIYLVLLFPVWALVDFIWFDLERVGLGFFVLALGLILADIPCMMLRAFGELVLNTHDLACMEKKAQEQNAQNQQNIELIARYLAAMCPADAEKIKEEYINELSQAAKASSPAKDTKEGKLPFVILEEDTGVCTSCGAKQSAWRTACFSCGARFYEAVDSEKVNKLIELRTNGIITDEEYEQAVSKLDQNQGNC